MLIHATHPLLFLVQLALSFDGHIYVLLHHFVHYLKAKNKNIYGCDGYIGGASLPHLGQSDLDGAYGSARVVLVQIVDVSCQRNAEEVVLLPQAAQLLVVHVRAHWEGSHSRTCADIPEFYGLVP